MESKISATIVADSINPQGNRLTSLLITFPRIILAEVNTHRMLSKNTSSSRAIPFKKMVEVVQNDPFIPIAWQKHHSGMQGSEYLTGLDRDQCEFEWLTARDSAVEQTQQLDMISTTKQLVNRLLEPFMWTTMLITGSKEGWDNFFNLRCPKYQFNNMEPIFKSKKDYCAYYNAPDKGNFYTWAKFNNSGAEIHIQTLAEAIYDVMNESTPKQLKAGEWHIPFENNLDVDKVAELYYEVINNDKDYDHISSIEETKVKISTAMAARVSYTVVGDEKEIDYQKQLELHDRLISQDPPHSSPLEHCNRAMTDEEYDSFIKGSVDIGFNIPKEAQGWCNNIKGFIPYRYMIDNNLKM